MLELLSKTIKERAQIGETIQRKSQEFRVKKDIEAQERIRLGNEESDLIQQLLVVNKEPEEFSRRRKAKFY